MAGLLVTVTIAAFAAACIALLVQQVGRGFLRVVDHLEAWREDASEPEPVAQPVPDGGPYRAPAFLIEPEPDPTSAEDRATSLGLCSAASLLAGVFTLSVDGPRLVAAAAFLLGALFAGLARRPLA